jgi:hypothetical protein
LKVSHGAGAGQDANQSRAAIAKSSCNNRVHRVRYEPLAADETCEFSARLVCGRWRSALKRKPISQHSLEIELGFDWTSDQESVFSCKQARH